jgi:hypothetical protein
MLGVAPSQLIRNFSYATISVPVVAGVVRQLVPADPNRVAIVAYPSIGNTYTCGPTDQISAVNGIIVTQQGFTLPFRYVDWGAMVGLQWYCCGVGFNGNVLVSTLTFAPVG